jgi:hypothetical protein
LFNVSVPLLTNTVLAALVLYMTEALAPPAMSIAAPANEATCTSRLSFISCFFSSVVKPPAFLNLRTGANVKHARARIGPLCSMLLLMFGLPVRPHAGGPISLAGDLTLGRRATI